MQSLCLGAENTSRGQEEKETSAEQITSSIALQRQVRLIPDSL